MADGLKRPIRETLLLAFLVPLLACGVLAAPPDSMEAVIAEYEADHSSVTGFYNLPWSTARLDRTDASSTIGRHGCGGSTSIRWTGMDASTMCSCGRSFRPSWMIRRWTGAGWPRWPS